LGELITTITDVAFEYPDDTKETYDLTCLVAVEILKTYRLEVKSLIGLFSGIK
jgi:hypothetical protein